MIDNIGICLATYNGEKFIEAQLNSLLRQTEQHWVLYIHDDGSTDNTLEILFQYRARHPEKIKIIDDNIYHGRADLNFISILEQVPRSDYYMFCDQDDIWLKDKIEITLQSMLESQHDNLCPQLIHTDLIVVNENLKEISPSFWNYKRLNYKRSDYNYYCAQNNITGCTVMFNHAAKERIIDYNCDCLMHDWWAGLMVSFYGEILTLEQATVLYRQHESNVLGARKVNFKFYVKRFVAFYEILYDYAKLRRMHAYLPQKPHNLLVIKEKIKNFIFVMKSKLR